MFDKMKVATRLLLLAGVLILFLLLIGVLVIFGMRESNTGMETVYNDRVVPLRDLKVISDNYAVNIVDIAHKVVGVGSVGTFCAIVLARRNELRHPQPQQAADLAAHMLLASLNYLTMVGTLGETPREVIPEELSRLICNYLEVAKH